MFKIGDKVKCIDNEGELGNSLQIEKIYEVIKLNCYRTIQVKDMESSDIAKSDIAESGSFVEERFVKYLYRKEKLQKILK